MKMPSDFDMADNFKYKIKPWFPEERRYVETGYKTDFKGPFQLMLIFMLLGGSALLGLGWGMIRFENEIAESIGWLVAL